ncbi:MAG: YiiX/YebB-like N1pC/P60 family cysteine hydrolase [Phycisphaeraceae bacterium]
MLSTTACSESGGDGPTTHTSGYEPRVGDVLFQSARPSKLVDMIEGVSESPYSHCGIVDRVDGEWVVYEAITNVSATPLDDFISRGRGGGVAVYRFREPYRDDIPEIIENTRSFLDRPYDFRYRLDDEHIYCSELIYKAFGAVTGEALGELDALGDLNWRPYEADIKELEKGPVPLEREMITPRGLAEAEQLELVWKRGIGSPARQ